MDYLNGKIAIESVKGNFGMDFDHLAWLEILKLAFSNGWNPSGRDSYEEITSDYQVGEFPVITEKDAYALKEILEKLEKESMERICRETGEVNFTKAYKKALEEMPWLFPHHEYTDLCELLSFGECYIRTEHSKGSYRYSLG
jgi:hypothetical protein